VQEEQQIRISFFLQANEHIVPASFSREHWIELKIKGQLKSIFLILFWWNWRTKTYQSELISACILL